MPLPGTRNVPAGTPDSAALRGLVPINGGLTSAEFGILQAVSHHLRVTAERGWLPISARVDIDVDVKLVQVSFADWQSVPLWILAVAIALVAFSWDGFRSQPVLPGVVSIAGMAGLVLIALGYTFGLRGVALGGADIGLISIAAAVPTVLNRRLGKSVDTYADRVLKRFIPRHNSRGRHERYPDA
jgi:hypothetical protein